MDESHYFEQFIGLDDIEEMTRELEPVFGNEPYEVKRYEGHTFDRDENLFVVNFWIHRTKEFDALERRMDAQFTVYDTDYGNYFIFRKRNPDA